IGVEKTHSLAKAKQEKVGTNLTVLTNLRVYHFEYTVVRKLPDPGTEEVMFSVRFIYPREEAERGSAELQRLRTEEQLRRAQAERPRNLAYWFCGSPALRPMSAFDDGVQTHIRFGARSELPAIFVKNDDKSESLINFNVEQDEIVIHRVSKQFVVRRGLLVGCIVNQGF